MTPADREPTAEALRRSGMRNVDQQISWSRQDTWTLKMPPVCAVTGEPTETAIIVSFGNVDLILPVTDEVRAEHDRPFGALRTAWRLRPSVRNGVVTLHTAAAEFVDQLIKLNKPGTLYAGGLYPLKPTARTSGPATAVATDWLAA